MAYTTDHGIVELSSTWAYAPATGPTPPTINDHGASWVIMRSAPGLQDGPESDDNREPRTTVQGEIIYPGLKLGRTFSLKCEVLANDEASMRFLLTYARRGYCFNMDDEGTWTVTPYTGVGGVVWNLKTRTLGFHPAESFTYEQNRPWKWRWEFELVVRMSDALFYSDDVAYV